MRALVGLSIFLCVSSFAESRLTMEEAMKVGSCRYESDPHVFRVIREEKGARADYELCISVVTCRVADETKRFHFNSPTAGDSECPTFEQAARLQAKEIKARTAGGISNADILPDPKEVFFTSDGSRCYFEDRPEVFWKKMDDISWANCFGTRVCEKNGEKVGSLIGCPPVPMSQWKKDKDGFDLPACPSISGCMRREFAHREARIIDLFAETAPRKSQTHR